MLGYVFWHWPDPGTDAAAYEAAQARFHDALRSAGSEGFVRSWSYHVEGTRWLPVAAAYEDWYLLEGSFALDPLNEVVISPAVRSAHDGAARAASGAGGLYRLQSGVPEPRDGVVTWLSKPRGEAYGRFYERFPATAVLWRRQNVLGPAPEFLLEAPEAPAGLAILRAERRVVVG